MAYRSESYNFIDSAGVTWTLTQDGTIVGVLDIEATVAGGGGSPVAIGINYLFDSTTTNSDPGPGNLRLSNVTQGSSTTVRADLLDVDGIDWTNVLDALDDSTSAVKGFLRLVKSDDPTKWILFTVSAVAAPAGYRNITVAFVAQSGANPFTNGDPVTLAFERTGDAGSNGTNGTNGVDGSQVYFGTGAPAGGLGVNGDVYERITGAVYKKVAGVWVDQAFPTKQLLFSWQGVLPGAIGAGVVIPVPKINGAAANIDLTLAKARVELTPIATNVQLLAEWSAGGGVFSVTPTVVATLNIAPAAYESAEVTGAPLLAVVSGDLLRIRFAALGGLAAACAYSLRVEGHQTS